MVLAQLYKCLSDESRIRILNILKGGIFNVQEITSLLSLSQPTVSHHLKILTQAGFVKSERDGTHAFYSLSDEANSVAALITQSALKACELAAEDQVSIFNSDQRSAQRLADERRTKTTSYFNQVAKNWSEIRSKAVGQENFLEDVKSKLASKDCVLDLGCGNGALLDHLLPREGSTIAIDCSESMLQECKKRLSTRARLVDLRLGYMEHLPVGDDTVDKAIAYMSLHHVPNPPDALKEAWRALKPGGQLIVVDLYKHDKEFMRANFADIWLGFEESQLTRWLQGSSFNNITWQPVGKLNEVFILTCNK